MAVNISITTWWNTLPAIVIENEFVEVVLFPNKGGEIHRYRRKQDGLDYLHVNENEVERFKQDKSEGQIKPLVDYFFAGCYTMFPNAGVDQIYEDIAYDYHGELRRVAWNYDVDGRFIKLSARLTSVPLGFERTITLSEHSTELLIEDTLIHVEQGGARAIPYIYGIHPYHTFPLLDEASICKVGGEVIEVLPERSKELSKLDFIELDDKGVIDIINPRLSTGIRFSFDPRFMKYVWVWFHFIPSANQYMNAIIPCTANGHDGIAGAVNNGSIRYMKPGERVHSSWSMGILDQEGVC